MLEDFVLMQQPAATFDEVIVAWDLEDMNKRFPAIVLQRDLQSGALSCRSRMAALLLNIVCCWISPGMTPVCQLTDTDFAKLFKDFLEYYKFVYLKIIKADIRGHAVLTVIMTDFQNDILAQFQNALTPNVSPRQRAFLTACITTEIPRIFTDNQNFAWDFRTQDLAQQRFLFSL